MRVESPGLGILEWKIWRAEKDVQLVEAPALSEFSATSENIHEKQLKGRSLSYRTEFGSPVEVPSKVYSTTKIDPEGNPFVTIQFKYTSKGSLIPGPPEEIYNY